MIIRLIEAVTLRPLDITASAIVAAEPDGADRSLIRLRDGTVRVVLATPDQVAGARAMNVVVVAPAGG